MSKLYRAVVSGSSADTIHWIDEGDPITVDGTPMVRLGHSLIVPAAGFVASKAEAFVAAADKLDAIAMQLRDKADSLRQKAAEVANG
jgi:hypothetical protein